MSDPNYPEDNRGIPPLYGNRERYAENWHEMFAERYKPYLRSGMVILDVGSGRTPAIPPDMRPSDCQYLGLDISADELQLAPKGSYDECFAYDLKEHAPGLDDRADLVVSWQVLEHIAPLNVAVDNVHRYLKVGGHFIGLLSGRNAHFSLVNRIIPEQIGRWSMQRLLNRPPDTVFRAHYDSCTFTDLCSLFETWSEVEVIPHFRGAGYLTFLPPAAKIYLHYEDWALRREKFDLATHYTLLAEK